MSWLRLFPPVNLADVLSVDSSPELALLCIRDRVESGGHNVPERDVRRRFGRALGNLFMLYRPLLDNR